VPRRVLVRVLVRVPELRTDLPEGAGGRRHSGAAAVVRSGGEAVEPAWEAEPAWAPIRLQTHSLWIRTFSSE